ncbi:putative hexose transport-related protein [Leucosporidium creatinivorum]|uniref:Putative hexose transport-related protein n=1 Tax=Leucosporidium creatinivorum TaxID=106004 RepID=A0A1Y2G1L5_9BASI|nr:putative hexose transport-related protein [Leucosporidium creatinivorum]
MSPTALGDGHLVWQTLENAVDHIPWYRNKGLMKLNGMIAVVYACEMLIGYDGTILSNLQALPAWKADLNYPSSSRIGLLNACSYIAGIISGPVASWALDKYGRRPCLQWFSLTMLLGTILGCVAGTVQGNGGFGLFCASKFIIGSGMAAGLMTAQIMLQEIAHPRYRTTTAALFDQNWALGHILGAFICLGTSFMSGSWSWRLPYIFQAPPAVIMVVAVYFMPETPRWLMSKGRVEEARQFLVKYHGNGNEDDELVKFTFQEIKDTLAAEEATEQDSWKKILAVPSNRYRLALVGLMTWIPQMDGAAIISFYYTSVLTLVGITGATVQTGIGAGLSMFGWCCQVTGVWAMSKTGRRNIVLGTWPVLLLCNIGLIVCTAVYANSGSTNTKAGIASVVMVWLYSGADSFAGPLFYSYPAEILNFSLRSKGMGVWTLVNQGWGLYGAYANPVALSALGYKYYCVYTALIIIQFFLMYFFVVETYGATLEEIAIAFEGKDSAVARIDARLEAAVVAGSDADSKEKI